MTNFYRFSKDYPLFPYSGNVAASLCVQDNEILWNCSRITVAMVAMQFAGAYGGWAHCARLLVPRLQSYKYLRGKCITLFTPPSSSLFKQFRYIRHLTESIFIILKVLLLRLDNHAWMPYVPTLVLCFLIISVPKSFRCYTWFFRKVRVFLSSSMGLQRFRTWVFISSNARPQASLTTFLSRLTIN